MAIHLSARGGFRLATGVVIRVFHDRRRKYQWFGLLPIWVLRSVVLGSGLLSPRLSAADPSSATGQSTAKTRAPDPSSATGQSTPWFKAAGCRTTEAESTSLKTGDALAHAGTTTAVAGERRVKSGIGKGRTL